MKHEKRSLLVACLALFALGWAASAIAQVDTAWVRRYNGPADEEDIPEAIAVDGDGSVYVTGASLAGPANHDCATIAYAPDGDTLWVRRYDGPDHADDACFAIQVDGLDNVFVAGVSIDTATHGDCLTIKFDSNGDTVWVRRYNGPSNGYDNADDLQIDALGNVYVTGTSWDDASFDDYLTLKYSPSGEMLWVRRYDGTGGYDDVARALHVDTDGNVYVTGRSWGTGSDRDYATLKYNTDGDLLWVRRYQDPGTLNHDAAAVDVDVDEAGNVYVTGYSGDDGARVDYATVKYNTNGDELWVRRYDGSAGTNDHAFAIAVDPTGDVFVTGEANGSGTEQDIVTIKYHPNGDTAWTRIYNGPANGAETASALSVDEDGNVYVAGGSAGSGGDDWDYVTAEYGSDGEERWVARYNGPNDGEDWATDIQVDPEGHVYVTGGSERSPNNVDYATIKYTPCNCPHPGDSDGDGLISVVDCIRIIDVGYRGELPPTFDPQCPRPREDVDCDSLVTIMDAERVIWYVFAAGDPPCDPCMCVSNPDDCRPIPPDNGNALIVESKQVLPGQTDVEVGIYLSNEDMSLQSMVLPLEIREVTPGAFMANHYSLTRSGRLASLYSPYFELIRYYNVPATENVCCGPDGHSYTGGTLDPGVPSAPTDAISLFNVGILTGCLPPGTDGIPSAGTPSLVLTFDVTTTVGSFEIDTCCITASNHVLMSKCGTGQTHYPDFTKGIIEIICHCPYQCDYDEDGFLTSLDLAGLIDVLYAGVPEVSDPGCSTSRGDFNGDGFPDPLDLSVFIDYLYASGDPPCDPCNPVASTCAE
jgi:uncharacterized delta-60 repeat protein